MPKMGANTIWESWEGSEAQSGVGSFNHYSKGAVCEWLFGEMCGIKVAEDNTYTVAHKVGGTLTHASCEYNGILFIRTTSFCLQIGQGSGYAAALFFL